MQYVLIFMVSKNKSPLSALQQGYYYLKLMTYNLLLTTYYLQLTTYNLSCK